MPHVNLLASGFSSSETMHVCRKAQTCNFALTMNGTSCLHFCSAPRRYPLPANAEETAQQARAAVQRAWQAGVKRQRVDLLLPLIGATDLDDWC